MSLTTLIKRHASMYNLIRASFRSRGFSLLEMAISLTIIALIIAALTVSQQIKTRLQLDQVVENRSLIESAVVSFENAYAALPGDYWQATTTFSDAGTKNGNGDNLLDPDTGGFDERLLFWQHLLAAGVISGSYDGVTNGNGGRMAAPLNKGYYRADTDDIWGDVENTLYIVAEKADGGSVFSVAQAFRYDTDYDDASPWTGKIRAGEAEGETGNLCITSGGEYNLSNNEDQICRVYFLR